MPKPISTLKPGNHIPGRLNRKTAERPQTLPIKVLQFGEGNFLRAFADWVVDLVNLNTDFKGAVQIVQPIAQGMGKKLNEQEGLYHVMLNGISQGKPVRETRLITSVAGVINPYEDYNSFLKAAENPALEMIISNTTEAGIEFRADDESPDGLPSTFPGKLTTLLHHRFKFFEGDPRKGLVIMPCELIDKNGTVLKSMMLKYIDHWQLSPEFRTWIEDHFIFCNTLVDRIVPGFPKADLDEIQKEIGYKDELVVTAESFLLWVIETQEAQRDLVKLRFPVAQAGLDVKFVTDLSPYRTRKVRILNGAHTALVPVAYLRGLRTVREAVDDPHTGKFIRETIFKEIIPTLDLPTEELNQYARDVIERFQNPYIHHELASIALNSISKFKVRVLPTITEFYSRKNNLPENLVHSLAALILFHKGEFKGVRIPIEDTAEVISFMNNSWSSRSLPEAVRSVLCNIRFWDQDLTHINGLEDRVIREVISISQVNDMQLNT